MSSTFCGDWIEAGHPAYGAARLQFNRRAGACPAVIARCLGVADVVAAVAHARERELPIEVRSGGLTMMAHTTCTCTITSRPKRWKPTCARIASPTD